MIKVFVLLDIGKSLVTIVSKIGHVKSAYIERLFMIPTLKLNFPAKKHSIFQILREIHISCFSLVADD